MKRKWPGVNQQLKQLNNGLREVYDGLASSILQIVRDAEKGYNRGTFDKVLLCLAMDYSGHRTDGDPLFEKLAHGGFSGADEMFVELTKDSAYANVTYGTLHVILRKCDDGGKPAYDFSFPVEYKMKCGDVVSVGLHLPEFSGVDMYDGDIITERYDRCIARMEKLRDDLKASVNILIRAVMETNKEHRYKVRDVLNIVAEKYGIKEAVYEED